MFRDDAVADIQVRGCICAGSIADAAASSAHPALGRRTF